MCIRDSINAEYGGFQQAGQMATVVQVPPPTQYTTVRITFAAGVAYRNSPNYQDRIPNVPGPTNGQQLTGTIVQGDVQYLQLANQYGGHVYVPLQNAQNGQQLAAVVPPPSAVPVYAPPAQQPPAYRQPMAQDLYRVQQGYRSAGRRYSPRRGGYCSDSSDDDCHGGYRRSYSSYGGGCHSYRGHGCHC
eukprot:TRINITY_DN19506_c0_g1_i2.p2 TRINITY_DN19506_c0_g1~~TRINITY_DN19506_c0_g1_i2.p2  ORF type:complete len:189 (-),score=18.95 TRINITY_DN19506_c0_g1_i2:290-856(-)